MGKKSKKKAIKKVECATKRDEPELPPGVEQHKRELSDVWGAEPAASFKEAIRNRWQPQIDVMVELYNSKAIGAPKNEEELNHKRKVIKMATDIINDMESITEDGPSLKSAVGLREESDGVRMFIGPQAEAYRLRSLCFMHLKMHKECIEDCSTTLQSGIFPPGTYYQVDFLMKRGISLQELDRMDEAIMDFRAAVASFRLVEKTWKGWPTLDHAKRSLFCAVCRQKVGSPRPHFSDEERDSLLKEVNVGHYDNNERKCLECGQQPTKDVPLCQCLGCRRVWFCNKMCQRKAWKGGHKEMCKATICHLLIGDVDEMKQALARGGFIPIVHGMEPGYITQDPVTGKLFNSLRDDELAVLGDIRVGANGRLFLQSDALLAIDPASTIRSLHDAKGCPEVKEKIAAYLQQVSS